MTAAKRIILCLWLVLLGVAHAPAAVLDASENRVWKKIDAPQQTRLAETSQVTGSHQEKTIGGAGTAVGCCLAAEVAPTVEQYSLRAAESGFYPVMTRGSSAPTAITWLEKGDVWKFGTTKNPLTRYSQSYLDNIGDYGVIYQTEWQGTAAEALQLEKMKIMNFKSQTGGVLPAGNKVIK